MVLCIPDKNRVKQKQIIKSLGLLFTVGEVESGTAGGTEQQVRGGRHLGVQHKPLLQAGYSQTL